jgi:hypothetical protein
MIIVVCKFKHAQMKVQALGLHINSGCHWENVLKKPFFFNPFHIWPLDVHSLPPWFPRILPLLSFIEEIIKQWYQHWFCFKEIKGVFSLLNQKKPKAWTFICACLNLHTTMIIYAIYGIISKTGFQEIIFYILHAVKFWNARA